MKRLTLVLLALWLAATGALAQLTTTGAGKVPGVAGGGSVITVGNNTVAPGAHTYTGTTANRITLPNPTTNGSPGNTSAGRTNGTNDEKAVFMVSLASLPSGGTWSNVSLFVYQEDASDMTTHSLTLTRVIRDGVVLGTGAGGMTWNTYDGTNPWGTAGATNTTTDIAAVVSATGTGRNGVGWIEFSSAQLAADIQDAMAAGKSYLAFVLENANDFTRINFASQSDTDGTRPYFRGTHTP